MWTDQMPCTHLIYYTAVQSVLLQNDKENHFLRMVQFNEKIVNSGQQIFSLHLCTEKHNSPITLHCTMYNTITPFHMSRADKITNTIFIIQCLISIFECVFYLYWPEIIFHAKGHLDRDFDWATIQMIQLMSWNIIFVNAQYILASILIADPKMFFNSQIEHAGKYGGRPGQCPVGIHGGPL